jgi:hypothetical protein
MTSTIAREAELQSKVGLDIGRPWRYFRSLTKTDPR